MIEADLYQIDSHRQKVEIERSRLRRYREVEQLYRELDHTEFDCFPSLPQFRKLPTLRAFQESILDVKSMKWRNEFVEALIKNDVREWATKTVRAFAEHLGYLEWPSTKDLVHPVHRFSSRFICTRCSKSGPKARRNKSLSFRGAAHHICLTSETGNKDQWSPKNFVVDTKVRLLMSTSWPGGPVLNKRKGYRPHYPLCDCPWCGCGGENYGRFGGRFTRHHVSLMLSSHRDGFRRHGGSGNHIQGKPPYIYAVWTPQMQHSHRHDDMQFMILADEELVKFSDYPVLPGIAAKLVQTNDQAKEWRSKVSVGCKHCISNPRKSPTACV